MTKNNSDALSQNESVVGQTVDLAYRIRLAGLGAYAKALQKGGELFESLVVEGERYEAQIKGLELAAPKLELLSAQPQMKADVNELERIFEDRLARALLKLKVPTHSEVFDLIRRMDELNTALGRLVEDDPVVDTSDSGD